MYISNKDELYTFDEFEILKTVVESKSDSSDSILIQKIISLQKSLEEKKDSMAIFFMPQNTFAVFSIFQGSSSLEGFTLLELQRLYNLLLLVTDDELKEFCTQKQHMENKLKVLIDFIKQGNEVYPMLTPADYLMNV